jgi:hypothetical protein
VGALEEMVVAILIAVFADDPNMKSRTSATSMLDMFAKHVRELLPQRSQRALGNIDRAALARIAMIV